MIRFAPLLAVAATPAIAAPEVAVDIAPVHSLVSRVMEGAGAPRLVLPQGASAHGHAMAPSEARVLAEADLLIWVGPALTPWIGGAAEALAPGIRMVTLLDAAEDDHGGHGDHDHGHAHGDDDPHVWLDPIEAAGMMERVADALAEADPANADLYRANASRGRADMEALVARIDGTLGAPRFVASHDAYGHFEERFGVEAMAALADGEDAPPGAGRVRMARGMMEGAACVFVENASESADLAEVLGGEVGARLVEVDPLGSAYEVGPGLYPALIEGVAEAMRGCGADGA